MRTLTDTYHDDSPKDEPSEQMHTASFTAAAHCTGDGANDEDDEFQAIPPPDQFRVATLS